MLLKKCLIRSAAGVPLKMLGMFIELPAPPEIAASRPSPRRSALRVFFSFPAALAALLLVLTVFNVRGRLNDPDMWWHLKAGEWISHTHSVPRADIFSFTAAGHPWMAQEWLSELTIYGAYHIGGYPGLMAWLVVVSSALVLAGYLLCSVYSGNAKIGFLGGMVTGLYATVGFAIRPHMLGYLLLVCELLILDLGRRRDARWFYALPPLFALWINFHSSFIFGFAVLAIVLGCAFLEFEWGLVQARRWPWSAARSLAVATALSALALLANPLGPKLIWFPLDVMLHQTRILEFVVEWQQTDFGSERGLILLSGAGLVILVVLLRSAKVRIEELLLLAMLFYMAARHVRMEFLFGLVVAPVLCRLLADFWERYQPERDSITPNAVLILIAAALVVFLFPSSRALAEQVDKANPVKAVEFIRQARLSGPVLNDYAYGGYLIWAAPERPVFIDGRSDLYEAAGILKDYMRFVSLDTDPQLLLGKYKISYCLFSRDQPIVHVMQLIPGWKQVYSDAHAVVFARQD